MTTTWLPEQFAVMDKYLQLKMGNVFENGWQVTSVSATNQSFAHLEVATKASKKTRKASDI